MYVLLRMPFKVYPVPCFINFLPECTASSTHLRWSSTDLTDNIFESKLRLLKWQEGEDDPNDLKAALYACPNHTDDGIRSDHGYLETWEIYGGTP